MSIKRADAYRFVCAGLSLAAYFFLPRWEVTSRKTVDTSRMATAMLPAMPAVSSPF